MTGEPDSKTQLFVVDCYDDSGGVLLPDPLPAVPAEMRLAYAVRVPTDDLVQALVEGPDEGSIRAALTASGWHIDRITPATWARLEARQPASTGGSPAPPLPTEGELP